MAQENGNTNFSIILVLFSEFSLQAQFNNSRKVNSKCFNLHSFHWVLYTENFNTSEPTLQ